jgi:SNF2 family DNA or RNA helicase
VHRIGQEKPVKAIRLVCRGTIEEKILKINQRKKELAEGAIYTEGFKLSMEHLKFLFDEINEVAY